MLSHLLVSLPHPYIPSTNKNVTYKVKAFISLSESTLQLFLVSQNHSYPTSILQAGELKPRQTGLPQQTICCKSITKLFLWASGCRCIISSKKWCRFSYLITRGLESLSCSKSFSSVLVWNVWASPQNFLCKGTCGATANPPEESFFPNLPNKSQPFC